ncbi:MAG: stage V sporulation protein AD [Bacilli bacterium]|nr:stage V sporulation protein AD [Bacilli bacterium]
MTTKYKNVYIKDTATVVGPYEYEGPLSKRFDKHYEDMYFNEETLEKAETKLMSDSIELALDKSKLKSEDINLFIAGDLQNQITSSTYAAGKLNIPFLGIYTACATNTEGLALGATYIESKICKNVMVSVSSHNMVSEKQFRNPTEYGAPKPGTATFTATGGATCILTNKKSKVRIESATIGIPQDYAQTDPLHMGSVMVPAAANTIHRHLTDLGRSINYYDLILTGDLGIYGKEILKDFMKTEYGMELNNYNDCGVMLYDLENQKEVQAGGSGPVCSALVVYSDILKKLETKELKRVLYVATGALFNPTTVFQKSNILSIANAISLESVE